MPRITQLQGVQIGFVPLELPDETGKPVKGMQLNIVDQHTGEIFQVPIGPDLVEQLKKELHGGIEIIKDAPPALIHQLRKDPA